MKIILLIFFLILSNCGGYQAINKIENSNYTINYNFSGDTKVNKIIKKNFDRFKENNKNLKTFDILINSNITKSNNSKNKSGEVVNLTLNVEINIEISTDNKIIKKLSLTENTSYSNNDNKFELKQFEKIVTNDLTNKLIQQIHTILRSIE